MNLILHDLEDVDAVTFGAQRKDMSSSSTAQTSPELPPTLRQTEDITHFDPVLDAVNAASNIELLMCMEIVVINVHVTITKMSSLLNKLPLRFTLTFIPMVL